PGGGGGARGGFGGGMPGQNQRNGNGGTAGQPGAQGNGGTPGQPGAQGNGGTPAQPGAQGNGFPGGGPTGEGGMGGAGGPGGVGGLLNGANVSTEAERLLERNASRYTWVAASIGSQNSAGYQLATGEPVMAIGGFNGTDPSPTLDRFKEYVAQGRIHYFIAGGGMGRGGGSGTASEISSWVQSTFEKVTVGSATFYDLTRRRSG
ncbi:glycosyl transferase, partial [Streptomyces sp. SID486]|nr:glycosyl transferase [Streptomyces sp. SID486]